MADKSARRTWWRRVDLVLRISAALVGTLPPAVLLSAALGRYLPISLGAGFTLGILLAIPLWVTGMCLGFAARRGWVAWIVCIAATAALALLVPDAATWPPPPPA